MQLITLSLKVSVIFTLCETEGGTGSKAEGEKRRMDALQSMFDCCLITAAAGGKG